MLSEGELIEYMAQLGLTLPSIIVEYLVEQVNQTEQCLIGAGLTPSAVHLSLLQAAAIMAISTGARRIKSRSSPSGASQSFEYGTIDQQGAMLRASIKSLGAWDCLGPILPKTETAKGGLMIGLGHRACR